MAENMPCDLNNMKYIVKEAEHLEKLGKLDEAFNAYTQFITRMEEYLSKVTDLSETHILKDELGVAYNNRGYIRYLAVDFDEAIKDYSHGLANNPKIACAYYNRGLIHYRMGRFYEAIADMQTCIELDPNFQDAKMCLDQAMKDRNNAQQSKHRNS
ncbi:hypothetical protein ACJMK2_003999 [Sinanodonta woodiana]|uniref:Tetratricopeptide repeat protein 32 n=1 Tax=Sinanodonta woodiana TaxID=1069815 RepID=A0ABD3Y1U2_SINWO